MLTAAGGAAAFKAAGLLTAGRTRSWGQKQSGKKSESHAGNILKQLNGILADKGKGDHEHKVTKEFSWVLLWERVTCNSKPVVWDMTEW